MERMNFKIEVSEEVLKEREKLINELKKNQLVLDFLKKNECDISLVENYPYRFKKWLEGLQICQKCNGLNQCKQENKGKVYDLSYDGYLDFILRSCRYEKKKKEDEAHLAHIVINDMPSFLYSMTMGKLTIDEDNLQCAKLVMDYLEAPLDKGFYIQGPVGTGKSTLAAAACNHFAKKGFRCAFVNVPEWVSRMKGALNDSDEIQKQIRILQRVDFLVLDDIGAENTTAWIRDELLFPILNRRMEEKKMTWFTSNEDWESLYDHYTVSGKFKEEEMKAVRIMERVKSLSKIVNLSGKNRRFLNE